MKKFKTVQGYLRSMEEQLHYKQSMAELNGQPSISDDEAERQIVNGLLPQLGVPGRIGANEKPSDGVKRLQQVAQGDAQIKALAVCQKWLGRARLVGVRTSATYIPSGRISDGQAFGPEESQALEAICREQKVSMTEAIEILRAKA